MIDAYMRRSASIVALYSMDTKWLVENKNKCGFDEKIEKQTDWRI